MLVCHLGKKHASILNLHYFYTNNSGLATQTESTVVRISKQPIEAIVINYYFLSSQKLLLFSLNQ